MSGHSKWSTIKRKKGAADAKRGKIFSRLSKEIAMAAKQGGGDPDGNPRLRTAVASARAANMPKDNVEKAIKKGSGDLPGVIYEEIRYEGYAAGGVALIIDVFTDNKNRTVADIRHSITKNNGSMAENGAVTWNFEQRGRIVVSTEALGEEEIFEMALEAGAEDVNTEEDIHEILTAPQDLHAVVEALEKNGIAAQEAGLTMIPKTLTRVEGNSARAVLRLLEALEELDDIQDVYSNFDISDEEMAAAMGE